GSECRAQPQAKRRIVLCCCRLLRCFCRPLRCFCRLLRCFCRLLRLGVRTYLDGRTSRRRAFSGDGCHLDGAPFQATPFALGEAAPDPESFVVGEGVLEAFGAHLASNADALGLPRRTALLREEGLRIGLRAKRALLPGEAAFF